MPTRQELERWDREHLWHPFSQMADYEPLIIERAHGCTLYDLDGRGYLDGVSSLWCNVHGHHHRRLDDAIREQIGQVTHTTLLGASNPTTIELARRLVEIAPTGLNHVFFSSDGSSAIEAALKMSLQYWRQRSDALPNKTRYVALGDAYHGDTIGSVSVGDAELFNEPFKPLLFDVLRLPTPRGLIADELARAERMLSEHHEQIAALVIEPLVQCAAGIVVHPPGYLRAIRELTRRFNVHLVADEVAVGFGRTGRMFACEHEQVTPDFLCLGKGLTAGYLPMAATMTTTDVWNAFLGRSSEGRHFYHGHTYSGNPLCAAVALESLHIFRDERVLERLPAKIDRLAEHLRRLAEHRHVASVRQCGLIAGIELVEDKATRRPYPAAMRMGHQVCRRARDQGVLIRPLGDVVVVMPPLAIRDKELDQIIAAVEFGLDACDN
ncbi:MAG: adenosylmethionine--8-amino-7-oxononanoate transaminase [Planctomycetaceae bacterium]|nr:adenosylmethionine--8-amino-7-oxononanoate transaminase [Planctomycetaceae bacterium]